MRIYFLNIKCGGKHPTDPPSISSDDYYVGKLDRVKSDEQGLWVSVRISVLFSLLHRVGTHTLV